MRIVPALDEAEDGGPGLGMRAEGAPVDQLALFKVVHVIVSWFSVNWSVGE